MPLALRTADVKERRAFIYNFISPFLVAERKKTKNHTISNKKAAKLAKN